MATREEDLQKRQEDLSLVVEPLVDSISELVLSSVTGAFENVQACCMDIAERTNKLVLIAQQVATSSTDTELQMDVANAINAIAVSIEQLVTSFTALLQASTPANQQAFAGAAREVGEAINKLCQAADQTSQHKLLQAVQQAREGAKALEEGAVSTPSRLLPLAEVLVARTVRLVQVARLAAGSTPDERKAASLQQGADGVQKGGPELIRQAKAVAEGPSGDPTLRSQLRTASGALESAFVQLVDAAKLSPSYFGKLNETYEYIKRLIEAAQNLEASATHLYNITSTGTDQEFLTAAKATGQQALAVAKAAEEAAGKEGNAVKRVHLQDAAEELRDASAAFLRAAKELRANPSDPTAQQNFAAAHERLTGAIRRVMALTGGEWDDSPQGRLGAAAEALESAARRVLHSAAHSPSSLPAEAATLRGVAEQLAGELERLAEQTTDPQERARLLADAAALRKAVGEVVAAAERVAANPSDAAAGKELAAAHEKLLSVLSQVRRDAHLIPGAQDSIQLSSATSAESQLIAAAKEEAAAALSLADEAEKLAAKISDPKRREAIRKAIQEVRNASKKVSESANELAANPHDHAAQQRLANAQEELGDAIQKVVTLTGSGDRDMTEAMADMKMGGASGPEGSLLLNAQNLLDKIAGTFGNPNSKLSGEEMIKAAKELSVDANELAKQLKEMAAKTSDPVFKEKLLGAAKLLRDGSIQIKILSAVRVAGGEDKGNSVAMAAKTLQTNVQDIIKEVRAESLRNKFRNTVKTTLAINRVVKNWRRAAGHKV